jgi:hypothetical protein
MNSFGPSFPQYRGSLAIATELKQREAFMKDLQIDGYLTVYERLNGGRPLV